MSLFLGSWGMNRSAGQTNRVNRKKLLIQNSHSNGLLTSFDVITVHVIRPYRRTFC